MANIKIASEAAVFAAADGLKLRGEEPTYERIVEVLGGGSNSTIKPHLINWKQMSGGHSRPTPESVLARATIFAEGVWGAALKEAQLCRRRFKSEPPCRSNIEPGVEADVGMVGCG
jgi:hypothetical protein